MNLFVSASNASMFLTQRCSINYPPHDFNASGLIDWHRDRIAVFVHHAQTNIIPDFSRFRVLFAGHAGLGDREIVFAIP
jgi:hypothetical protein